MVLYSVIRAALAISSIRAAQGDMARVHDSRAEDILRVNASETKVCSLSSAVQQSAVLT